VYALANYINRNKEIIPNNIIHKAPSAELRPNQKDSDSLPDYNILDKILYQYIERRMGPNEIKDMGFDDVVVDRTLKLVNTNEYKRNQFCPIIRVSPKAFGVGRRSANCRKIFELIFVFKLLYFVASPVEQSACRSSRLAHLCN
jgi:NAD+ synthase (glutamine-hydrolysing)